MIAAPMPCTARAALSMVMSCASPQASEARVNSDRPMVNIRRRPRRSARKPALSTVLASASVYASTTHCRPLRPVPRSSAMRDNAVLTTAMSSMSIAVAAHTTTRVQRWMLRMGGGSGGGRGRKVGRASSTARGRASVVSLMVRWSYLYLGGVAVAGAAEHREMVDVGERARGGADNLLAPECARRRRTSDRLFDETGLAGRGDRLLEHLVGVVRGRPAELVAGAGRVHHDRHAEGVEPLRLGRHERQPGDERRQVHRRARDRDAEPPERLGH